MGSAARKSDFAAWTGVVRRLHAGCFLGLRYDRCVSAAPSGLGCLVWDPQRATLMRQIGLDLVGVCGRDVFFCGNSLTGACRLLLRFRGVFFGIRSTQL